MNKLYLDTCAGSLGIAIVTKDKTCKSEINAGKKTAEELFKNQGISEDMPSITISKEILDINIVDLLVETKLASSKSEAKRLIEQNGISLNKNKVKSVEQIITSKDLQDNSLFLQKGKKIFLKVNFQ